MMDLRIVNFAQQLINSVGLCPGENILIETTDTPPEMTSALVWAATSRMAKPLVHMYDSEVQKTFIATASKEAKEAVAARALAEMKDMQAYIAVRGAKNAFDMAYIPDPMAAEYKAIMNPVTRYRVDHTKWCVTRWPNASMAQAAGMPTVDFEDYFFNACLVDYTEMARKAQPLVDRMNKAKEVHIVANGTDLVFSIEGMPAIPCCGEKNIPDGEVYTAPVRDSVNGVITFNTPTVYLGKPFSNIRLEFKDGKIVNASCESGDQKALDTILDTDDGARYIGEFAMGLNENVTKPMRDILFDEKIAGSIHFTPGNAYQDAWNGNKSAIHWDLVLIMRPEYGGGCVWFDDKAVLVDGKFVDEDINQQE